MDAGVATDQRPIVHGESMRVGGVGCEIHDLEYFARRPVVFDQARLVVGIDLGDHPGDGEDRHRPGGTDVERLRRFGGSPDAAARRPWRRAQPDDPGAARGAAPAAGES